MVDCPLKCTKENHKQHFCTNFTCLSFMSVYRKKINSVISEINFRPLVYIFKVEANLQILNITNLNCMFYLKEYFKQMLSVYGIYFKDYLRQYICFGKSIVIITKRN